LIREARLRAGLTQQQLADRTGRERSVIARWEQGAVSPSITRWQERLHRSLQNLFGYCDAQVLEGFPT